jgi:DNA sulfur modification protein DndD
MQALTMSLRVRAVQTGHCDACDQDLSEQVRVKLRASLAERPPIASPGTISPAMSRLADLGKFREADNSGEVRQLWKRLQDLQLQQAALKDRLSEIDVALSEAEPETLRRNKSKFGDVIEKIATVKRGIEDENRKTQEIDQNIQRIKKKLESAGAVDLRESQMRAKILRDASEVFAAAVERYKADLRTRVEETATKLFLAMTTERQDYSGLTINEAYGLTIRHRDGRIEEARSAGAEHVVALALMGALQNNAPLKGPIVMDSPFGRLDDEHTSNVIRSLPDMAEQIILLVYEAEVGRDRIRDLLQHRLLREYGLERVSSRRTNVRQVT